MLFNSIDFAFFFIIVTTLYFILPHRFRWFLLLAASCYFYMAFVPVYILILAFTIIIDYFAGIFLEQIKEKKRKRVFLIASLIANIGVLAVFKYYNFINFNIELLLSGIGYKDPLPYLSILLPIGLSFHTFQAMSYTIEVYRGNQRAERHFGIYALYVMFYPQLVAGPIERPQNLLYQFYEKHSFNYVRVTNGLKLIAWGLFKKVVIADRLAILVDDVYSDPHKYNGTVHLMAIVFFSFQIFCDFSGYSDMAIGAADVMGFKFMQNFNKPYHSKSISEFWTRWHISLSSWFKDYLYIPLGGNRVAVPRWYFNLLVVFLLSGLWHGANWTFVLWGALHWFYIVFAATTKKMRHGIASAIGITKYAWLNNALQIVTTFVLVSIAWVFFRAAHLQDAIYILKHAANGLGHISFNELPISKLQFVLSIAGIALLEVVHIVQQKVNIREWLTRRPVILRWSVYYATILTIVFLGIHESRQFIYFQF